MSSSEIAFRYDLDEKSKGTGYDEYTIQEPVTPILLHDYDIKLVKELDLRRGDIYFNTDRFDIYVNAGNAIANHRNEKNYKKFNEEINVESDDEFESYVHNNLSSFKSKSLHRRTKSFTYY